ncbi:hypothetical protein NQ315_005315 [Exocentrus adspersus]|uniref:Uncharacterized protein n=1 Tax=Exocentrus adspersus TaxID=1586481 RepID=A0AAV8W183_9CUCU|nr:hypothetical protein NQ315_005315 [Exocentrus adspersus]
MFESQEYAAKKLDSQDFDENDIIPGTPVSEIKKIKFRKRKINRSKKPVLYQECGNNNYKYKIDNTKTGTFSFNKPFVYHHLTEVSRYSLYRFPKNNNIHLIGVHKFSNSLGHYLESCSNDDMVCIPLDFTVSTGIPDIDVVVSVFGSIEFKSSALSFVVKFFRQEAEIVVRNYIQSLCELRKYIPTDYVATTSNSVKIRREH